jgi:5-methylcytosine-specific restriction enzyme subunit McrC
MATEHRLIRLREWKPTALELTPEELVDLQRCGADLVIQPRGSTEYEVTPKSTVGSVTTPRFRLVIEPKFEIDRLFHLLGRSHRINFLREATELDAHEDITEGFIAVYLNMVRRRLRRGLLKGYRTEEESLHTVRGRIRVADQLRRRFALPLPLEVAYDDYTEDIPENRLIKAALRRLEVLRPREPALRKRIAETLAAFTVVTDERYSRNAMPTFRYSRLTEPYRPVLELSALIVQNLALDLAAGHRTVTALLFDMNKIFEDFVFASMRLRLAHHLTDRERWVQGETLRLDREGSLRPEPDLSWWHGGRCVFVGDAKYKLTAQGHLSDLYQLLAYCSATGLTEGLLIYAEQPQGPVNHQVVHRGPTLRVASIDVTAPVEAIERCCDQLADEIRDLAGLA